MRQHGNVTRAQLLALSLSDKAIRCRLRAGRLHRVHRGVYAVGRPPVVPLERAAAAVLACGPHAALSHTSALVLWEIWKRWPPRLEITVHAGDPRPKGIHVHRSRTLARAEITRERGIPVTTPARTLLDCAPGLTFLQLARAVSDGRHACALSTDQLRETLARHPRHPGSRRLRAVLGDGAPTRSDWERAFPRFCARHGLPKPRLAATVAGHEVDALFAAERVIVELDSWDFHQDRHAFETDRDRDADTAAAGHLTVRITWERMHARARREADRLHEILAGRRG